MIALPAWDLSEARGPGNWTPNTRDFVGTLSLDEPIWRLRGMSGQLQGLFLHEGVKVGMSGSGESQLSSFHIVQFSRSK